MDFRDFMDFKDWKQMMPPPRLLAVLLGTVALVWAGTRWWEGPTMASHDECPIDTLTTDYQLSGAITRIPEFHDCQRFIERVDGLKTLVWQDRYDSLYALWVREGLDTARFSSNFLGQPGAIRTSRIYVAEGGEIMVDTIKSESGVTATDTGAIAVAVAIIFTYAEEYKPLGIKRGFNCVYLADPNAWKAIMVPVPSEDACFADKLFSSITGTHLSVHPVAPSAPLTGDDVPPVGRWDWDPTNGKYYVGLRCLNAWCEVGYEPGAPTLVSSASYTATAAPAHQRRTIEIKGWYDQQYLAVPSWPNSVSPSPMLGTAFPDSGLHGRKIEDYDAPGTVWLPASHTSVRGKTPFSKWNGTSWSWVTATASPGTYKSKLNFDLGAVLASMDPVPEFNTTFLCHGDKDKCIPPAHQQEVATCATNTSMWWARVISSALQDTVFKCVTFTSHPGITMPGVVRWRWLNNDETHWISCPEGCCRIQ